MAYDAEGTVYISMEDWVKFLNQFIPGADRAESLFGKPRIANGELEVDYALSTSECHPGEWATPPKFVTKEAAQEAHQAAMKRAFSEICELVSMSKESDPMQVVAQLRSMLFAGKE